MVRTQVRVGMASLSAGFNIRLPNRVLNAEAMRVGPIRTTSKRLFGDRYMLELCLAVARATDRVNLSDLAASAQVTTSLYSKPVQRLRALELLLDAPMDGDDYRVRWYRRAESSLWTVARELAQ